MILLFISLGSPLVVLERDIFKATKGSSISLVTNIPAISDAMTDAQSDCEVTQRSFTINEISMSFSRKQQSAATKQAKKGYILGQFFLAIDFPS